MAKKETQPEATKYSVAELVAAGPSIFGVSPELMAGALHGKEEATKEEAETLLKEFLGKPVNQDEAVAEAPAEAVQDEEKGAAN
ncbi:hypothetical protein ACF5W4_11115 [Bacillota bacterium Lsc_1132]